MTVTAARAAAEQLRTALLDHGVRAVSIELQPGVGPKADPWGVAPFVRGLGHHIVSRPPGTPGLALVKRGRTGANALQGPLCNGYGGFDLTARIITMGWANHPGAGGPWSVPGWGTVPKDNGRPYIFGWEFEGGIVPWTDEQHEFMARCGAGTLDWLGALNRRSPAPLECWGEHGHPWAEGRKIDRLGYTAASGRARIAAVRPDRRPTGATPPPAPDALEALVAQMTQAQLDQYLADTHLAAVNSQVIADAVTVGREGVKHDGDLITALRRVEAPALTTADALTLGKEGVKYDGDVVSLLKDVAASVSVSSPTS